MDDAKNKRKSIVTVGENRTVKRSVPTTLTAIVLLLCSLLVSCGSPNKQDGNENPKNETPDTLDTTPVIYINTAEEKEIPVTKEEVDCTVTLAHKDQEHCATDLSATVRCRGNGSMTVGKRTGKFPYKLKFARKVNPFGLGDDAEKDWVLLAHVGDQTMLRNFAAKLLGEKLTGIPYSPNVMLVNVFLNGEYIGVYELTEQIEVKDCRIDIHDELTGKENGFLIELDAYAATATDDDDPSFLVGNHYYTIKSDVYNEHQLGYIRNYITQAEAAIYAGDRDAISQLIDINSLVDMFLLQEYAKNIDVGFSSFYMYKDIDGKLFFAPPWDFDLAFGNDARLDNGSYEEFYVGTGRKDFRQNHDWYIALYSYTDWFKELVKTRWAEITDTVIPEVIDAVKKTASAIETDMQFNYKHWEFLGKKQQQEPKEIVNLRTYKEHADYLIRWMENRKAWLDTAFSSLQNQ